jgi:hypothetical protein
MVRGFQLDDRTVGPRLHVNPSLKQLGIRIARYGGAQPAKERLARPPLCVVKERLEPAKARLAQRDLDAPR